MIKSTCNHCFGNRKKATYQRKQKQKHYELGHLNALTVPSYSKAFVKVVEPTVINNQDSNESLSSSSKLKQLMLTSRPSIMMLNGNESKKKLTLMSTGSALKSDNSTKVQKSILKHHNRRIPNTNRSCIKDSDSLTTYMLINPQQNVESHVSIEKELKYIQVSNNVQKYPPVRNNEVNDLLQIFLLNFKKMKNQSRFIFIKDLGEGAFGQVIECQDMINKRISVAVKITKEIIGDRQNRTHEIDVLLKLHQNDPSKFNHCATLLNWLKVDNRLCLVFPKYGDNLFIFMKKRKFEPLSVEIVTQIAFQLFCACSFLHDKCRIIHTDLKPENILLTSQRYITKEERGIKVNMLPSKLDIKIIDFGNAVRIKEKKYTQNIGTRQYRALEVILGQEWDEKTDCWSIGCILYELYTGRVLFRVKDESTHLAMIEDVIGPINPLMIKTCKMSHLFLESGLLRRDTKENKRTPIQFFLKQNSVQCKMLSMIIIDCLKNYPLERPNCKDILKSPLLNYLPENIQRRFRKNYRNYNFT